MKEICRKSSHMFFGIIIALFLYFVDHQSSVIVMSAVVFLSVCISDAVSHGSKIPLFSWIIKSLERDNTYPGLGTILFFISTLFCQIIFGNMITSAAVLTLAVLDGISTMVGVKFGKHKIYKKKSLEGTVTGILCGIIVLALFPGIDPRLAVMCAVAAGITELYTPIDDNLTIPVVVSIILSVFSVYV